MKVGESTTWSGFDACNARSPGQGGRTVSRSSGTLNRPGTAGVDSRAPGTVIRVLLVNDDPVRRGSVHSAIAAGPGPWSVRDAGLLDTLTQGLPPEACDVVVVNPDTLGAGFVAELKPLVAAHPWLPFVVLTAQGSAETAVEVMKIGSADLICVVGDWALALPRRLTAAVRASENRNELRRLERETTQALLRYRDTFEGATLGLVQCSLDGRFLRSNPKFREMVGYGEDELLGMSIADIAHPDDRTDGNPFASPVRRGEAQSLSSEKRYVHRDGTCFPGKFTVSASTGIGGDPEFLIGVLEDLTEHRATQDALKKSEEQVFQLQRTDAVGRLAGGVAHDFNNLITIILGYSESALREVAEGAPTRDALEEINAAATRGASLTRQLLAFSRQQPANPVPVDLNIVVRQLGKLIRRLIGEDIVLEFDLQAEPALLLADPGHVEQLVMNLALNARDAMSEGGRFTVSTRNVSPGKYPPGSPPSACDRPGICLRLSDTGHGIPPDILPHVFEPFFTTKEKGKGTGLGLPIVLGIVEQAGGFIQTDTKVGQGTTFSIHFPEAPAENNEVSDQPSAAPIPRGFETVLVVEDDDFLRRLTEQILEQLGYSVMTAQGGAEAIQLGENHRGEIHLLITDLVMPGLDGRRLSRRLRLTRPDIRTVFMSGYPEQFSSLRDSGCGENPYLEKPFTVEALAQAVRKALDS